MKITLDGKWVSLEEPALDAQGAQALDAQGAKLGTSHTMTLEQYERHARAPQFVAAAGAVDHAKVMAARNAEVQAALNAALDAAAAAGRKA